MRFGTWNVRTLLAPGAAKMLVAELQKGRVSIMGLQEVRWPDAGEMSVADHTILWSGPPEGTVKQAGVALVLDKSASASLKSWDPVSSRLLTARLAHHLGSMTVIVAYAPTEDGDDAAKDEFYQRLEQAVQRAGQADLILCLGDFNAVSGTARDGYRSVVGPFGSGSPNNNTDRLLTFCLGAGLRLAGSWFQRRNIHRNTWYSNDGRTVKEIDHVLVNARWKAVQNCRVYRSMESQTGGRHYRHKATPSLHNPECETPSLQCREACRLSSPPAVCGWHQRPPCCPK